MATARPVRLQRKRTPEFDLQTLSRSINGLPAVSVTRPGKFGNPFTIKECRGAGWFGPNKLIAQRCVRAFEAWAFTSLWRENWDGPQSSAARSKLLASIGELRGKNLACFCALCDRHAATGKPFGEDCPDCAPCHADVLGRRANMICEAAPATEKETQ